MVIGEPVPVAVTPPGELVTVYWVMVAPPLLDGGLNDTVALPVIWPGDAVTTLAVPMTGAPGTVALTMKAWLKDAGAYAPPPAWLTVMEQLPAVTNCTCPDTAATVHTPGVLELNTSGRPLSTLADRVGVVPNVCVPGLLKVMFCAISGVTAAEGADAGLSPSALRAVTVKV